MRTDGVPTDPVVTPEAFAQSIVDDYGLTQNMHIVITKSIQEQLSDYKAHTAPPPAAPVSESGLDESAGRGVVSDEDAKWWEAWRSRAKARAGAVGAGKPEGVRSRKRRKVGVPEEADEEYVDADPYDGDDAEAEEEMRIVVKVCRLLTRGGRVADRSRFLPTARHHRRLHEAGRPARVGPQQSRHNTRTIRRGVRS